MEQAGKKSKWWSQEEKEVLVEGVEKNIRVINSKFSDTVTNVKKKKCWADITKNVSACGVCLRSADIAKKKWEDLKSRTKAKSAAINREENVTGGGKKIKIDLTQFERRILALIGETAIKGLQGAIDTTESSPCSADVEPTKSEHDDNEYDITYDDAFDMYEEEASDVDSEYCVSTNRTENNNSTTPAETPAAFGMNRRSMPAVVGRSTSVTPAEIGNRRSTPAVVGRSTSPAAIGNPRSNSAMIPAGNEAVQNRNEILKIEEERLVIEKTRLEIEEKRYKVEEDNNRLLRELVVIQRQGAQYPTPSKTTPTPSSGTYILSNARNIFETLREKKTKLKRQQTL
ncbi:myb-related transcription factor, partner of profilin-like [Lineus longissimus]|uniref:myb-related transcription factor, partner of profilin-like n=1 Tax=Lineus longissimus TaxID=88925 RepID=UPI00315D07C2